ncbi:hypothetical protein ACFLTX_00095 [Chloroflexota bacterium]
MAKNKKRGAPYGNLNSFKHGFYARHYSREEIKQLKKTSEDIHAEIALLRVQLDRVMDFLDNVEDFSTKDISLLNTALAINLAIGRHLRTNSYLNGSSSSLEDIISEIIQEETDDWELA